MKKRVTVLMPVYNASQFLDRSIKSILSSTFSDFELLIIDDGSTDNSEEIIKTFNDSRIKLVKNDHNYIQSLNLGLKLAEGEYIARMDADDIMLPERLQIQVNLLDSKKDVDICSSWMMAFGGQKKYKPIISHAGYIDILDQFITKKKNPIYHPTVMIRKDVLERNSLKYNPEFNVSEDLRLWLDLGKLGNVFYVIPRFLHLYQLHQNQVSNTKRDLQKHQTEIMIKELSDEN